MALAVAAVLSVRLGATAGMMPALMASAGPETIHARQGVPLLAERLAALGTRRVLVLSSPSRRFVDQVVDGAAGVRTGGVRRGARCTSPREVVDAAARALADSGADTVVAVGGGSAIGLGKALRLGHACASPWCPPPTAVRR